jgi:3-oxoacyl-[acyl-carrier-protein] synthase II
MRGALQGGASRGRGDAELLIYSGSYCTPDADRSEAEAVYEVTNGSRPRVTNIRGAVGEMKGVSGLLNVVAACRSIQTGMIPHTVGCDTLDPGCDVNVVQHGPVWSEVSSVLCNAFWVNGINASLLVSRMS